MRLLKVRLENFQGIRSASLSLDPLSVVFGENGCGKTSLFGALELCLGRGELSFRPQDHHRNAHTGQATGPIRFELTLDGQDRPEALEPFREAGLGGSRLRLEVHSETGWVLRGESGESRHPELLASLRRSCPLVRLRGGLLRAPRLSSDQPVARAVEAVFASLLDSAQVSSSLVDQALQLLSERRDLLEGHPQVPSVQGRVEAPMAFQTDLPHLLQGSGSRSMALLLLASLLLEATESGPFPMGSTPLLVLEDPDAGLHPVALATIWSLLQNLPAAKLLSTCSPDLLAAVPLGSLRRMVRDSQGQVNVYSPRPEAFDTGELRRAGYHIRVRRGLALLMRAWLLVEGESEFWLCHEAARACGWDLSQEAVACLEFAQVGLVPMARLASSLGIPWFLLADGDRAGRTYSQEARGQPGGQVYHFSEPDLEHCLWNHGYQEV